MLAHVTTGRVELPTHMKDDAVHPLLDGWMCAFGPRGFAVAHGARESAHTLADYCQWAHNLQWIARHAATRI